jgi:hypothetical protein
MDRELGFTEFKLFYECTGKPLSEADFTSKILAKFCGTSTGITFRGFRNFFIDAVTTQGEVITIILSFIGCCEKMARPSRL